VREWVGILDVGAEEELDGRVGILGVGAEEELDGRVGILGVGAEELDECRDAWDRA
jgi:hypothetical protein